MNGTYRFVRKSAPVRVLAIDWFCALERGIDTNHLDETPQPD
jgi:hypothetical protein